MLVNYNARTFLVECGNDLVNPPLHSDRSALFVSCPTINARKINHNKNFKTHLKSELTGQYPPTHWIIGFSPACIRHLCSVGIGSYRLPIRFRSSSMGTLPPSLIGSHRIPRAVVAPSINNHLLLRLRDAPYGCVSGCGCPSCSGAWSGSLGRVAVLPVSL